MKRILLSLVPLAIVGVMVCLLTSQAPNPQHPTSDTQPPTTTGSVCRVANATAPQHHINVVILGDSQTWIGGDDCDKPRGWNKWFKDRFQPATIKSYARSGASWTNTPNTVQNTREDIGVLGDNNVIYNQVERLREALKAGTQPQPQLIIVFAGANDAWFAAKRPHLFDKTAAQVFADGAPSLADSKPSKMLSLAESVRFSCEQLLDLCPSAQIVLLTPMQMTKVKDSVVARVSDLIADCGKAMSLHVIRMDRNSCVNSAQERKQLRMTTDGVHTSELGAQRNGYYIANQINSILQW